MAKSSTPSLLQASSLITVLRLFLGSVALLIVAWIVFFSGDEKQPTITRQSSDQSSTVTAAGSMPSSSDRSTESASMFNCSPGNGSTPVGVDDIPEGPGAFGYWSVKTSATSWGVIDIPVGSDTLFCIDRKKAVRFKYMYLDGTTKEVEDTKLCAKDNSCKHDHHTGVDEIHFQATDPEEEDYIVVRIYPRS